MTTDTTITDYIERLKREIAYYERVLENSADTPEAIAECNAHIETLRDDLRFATYNRNPPQRPAV